MRLDYIFSYWIFIWFILYKINIIKLNPLLALLIALVQNLIVISLMFYYGTKTKLKILFTIGMFILKIIPIYILIKNKTRISTNDIKYFILLFLIYIGYLKLNNIQIDYLNKIAYDLIFNNKLELPFINLFDRLINIK